MHKSIIARSIFLSVITASLIAFTFISTANAFSVGTATMPIKKAIKTFGIGTVEKSLLQGSRYVIVSGKIIAQRNSTFYPTAKDALGRTNIDRMALGLAPIGKDGVSVELHHIKQKDHGILLELTRQEHNNNSAALHRYRSVSEINRSEFEKFRSLYWRKRAESFK